MLYISNFVLDIYNIKSFVVKYPGVKARTNRQRISGYSIQQLKTNFKL